MPVPQLYCLIFISSFVFEQAMLSQFYGETFFNNYNLSPKSSFYTKILEFYQLEANKIHYKIILPFLLFYELFF